MAEGYLGNGKWLDTYYEPNTYRILKTPFDWTGYDIVHEPEEENTTTTIEDIIERGETKQVEFKPSLLYNFKTKKAGIGIKNIIAKSICAFLNTKGGFLFIGIKDNGETQGLSYDFSLSDKENPKDYFKLEFDQMLKYFFSPSIIPNINTDFFQRDEKDIFVVGVEPSKKPVFLKGEKSKEFYTRYEASTRQIEDIEEIINYCKEKWGQ